MHIHVHVCVSQYDHLRAKRMELIVVICYIFILLFDFHNFRIPFS